MFEKLDNPTGTLKQLVDYIISTRGINGGDPSSPIWMCSLEGGGGVYSQTKEWTVDKLLSTPLDEPSNWPLDHEEVQRRLSGNFGSTNNKGRCGGSAFYRSIFAILTALIEKDASTQELTRARQALSKYHFLSHQRLGFSFNIGVFSLPDHNDSKGDWTANRDRGIRLSEGAPLISFADWTGVPTYKEFFRWCAEKRHPIFNELRHRFQPRVIYCAGITSRDEYSLLWCGKPFDNHEFSMHERQFTPSKKLCVYSRWLDSQPNENQTLLLIGPFFGHKYSLNSYAGNRAIARIIQELVPNESLGLEGFIP